VGAPLSAPRLLAILDRASAPSDAAFAARVATLVAALDAEPRLAVRARGPCLGGLPVHPRLFVDLDPAAAAASGHRAAWWTSSRLPAEAAPRPATVARVGASVHGVDEAVRAVRAGADLLLLAPIFAPRSKPGEGRGVALIAAVTAAVDVPVLALGGVTPDRVAACLDAGAHGVAALTPFSATNADLLAKARELLAALPG
jgi:thiamine monophosphate synthase